MSLCEPSKDTGARETLSTCQGAAVGFSEPDLVKEVGEGEVGVAMQGCFLRLPFIMKEWLSHPSFLVY